MLSLRYHLPWLVFLDSKYIKTLERQIKKTDLYDKQPSCVSVFQWFGKVCFLFKKNVFYSNIDSNNMESAKVVTDL